MCLPREIWKIILSKKTIRAERDLFKKQIGAKITRIWNNTPFIWRNDSFYEIYKHVLPMYTLEYHLMTDDRTWFTMIHNDTGRHCGSGDVHTYQVEEDPDDFIEITISPRYSIIRQI